MSLKGHLCLPGLPGNEEEAVIGSIDPVGASLANHYSSSGVSAAAAAAVVLQEKGFTKVLLRQTAMEMRRKNKTFTYDERSSC